MTQGADSGTQYGRAACAKPLFSGVEQSSFLQDESGDLSGKYQQWFNSGSVYGQYTLTAQDTGPPTTTSFTNASYTGTISITNGTGLFKKATGSGTLACTTHRPGPLRVLREAQTGPAGGHRRHPPQDDHEEEGLTAGSENHTEPARRAGSATASVSLAVRGRRPA